MKYSPYSFSKISTFKQCPKKFKYMYIDKLIGSVNTKAIEKGSLIHNIIELVLKNDIKSLDTSKYQLLTKEEIDEVLKIAIKFGKSDIFKTFRTKNPIFVEQRIKLTNQLEPTENRLNSMINGVIDYLWIDEENKMGITIDWKTGGKSIENLKKYPKDKEQLELYGLWALQKFNLNYVKNIFVYVEWDYLQEHDMSFEDIGETKNKFFEIINKIEECSDFIKKLGPLCDYCGALDICKPYDK